MTDIDTFAEIERIDDMPRLRQIPELCYLQDHSRNWLKEINRQRAEINRLEGALSEARMEAGLHELVKIEALDCLQAFEQFDGSPDLWAALKRQRDEADARAGQLEQTVIRQRDLMSRLKDRADIARENCATADARAKETVQQQMAELRGTNASLREDIEHQQAEARRLQSDLIQLLASLRVIAGLSPADTVQALDDVLNLFMVPDASDSTVEESAEEEATTP